MEETDLEDLARNRVSGRKGVKESWADVLGNLEDDASFIELENRKGRTSEDAWVA